MLASSLYRLNGRFWYATDCVWKIQRAVERISFISNGSFIQIYVHNEQFSRRRIRFFMQPLRFRCYLVLFSLRLLPAIAAVPYRLSIFNMAFVLRALFFFNRITN